MNISIITERSMNGHFATLVLSFIIAKGSTKGVTTPPKGLVRPLHPFYTLPDIDLRHESF